MTYEEVYNIYYDSIGRLHWTGVHTGTHIIEVGVQWL